MKKTRLIVLFTLFATYYSNAQTGINTQTPDASAALEIKSPDNKKGLLIPRSTTAQINAIPSPAEGLIVYDTTQHCFLQNAGTPAVPNWRPLVNAADNGLTTASGKIQLGGTLTKPSALLTTATNTLAIQGLSSSTDNTDSPIVMTTDGTLKKGAFPVVNVVPADVGSVISVDGKLEVAQEITALMTASFTYIPIDGIPAAIGNISNVLIDNKASFTSSATSNSFKVKANGVYSVNINLVVDAPSGTPVIGIWCDTDNKWVARINSGLNATRANLTLITAIDLDESKTYSFRSANTDTTTITAFNTGSTGTGPVAYYSLKRLK